MDPARRDLERQWRVALAWLTSDDARAAAASELRGLSAAALGVDDLLADTAVRVWRSLDARAEPVDEGTDGGGVVRYARRALRNAAIDAFRGAARRPEVPVPEPIDLDDPGDGAESHHTYVAGVRRSLTAEMDTRPRSAAVALATVALLVDDLTLADDVTQPERGATPSQAAVWAGLWFVEGDDLFPGPSGVDDAALRQRRRRAAARAHDMIRRALEASSPGDDGV